MPDTGGPNSHGSLDPKRLRTGLLVAVAIGVTVGLVVTVVTGGPAVLAGIERLPIGWLLAALALSLGSWLGQGVGFAALA